MKRRTARRHAFILIYQFPFHAFDIETLSESKLLYYSGLLENERPRGKFKAYIDRAVTGTWDRLDQIDGVILHFLKGWEIERINKIDLTLIRLSIYEMLCEEDIPVGVSISEAVAFAKEYGTDKSSLFVNGVLGRVSKQLEKRNE